MFTTVSWLIPIILLPGVALLIMSTSLRYGQIHEELHHMLEMGERVSGNYFAHLYQRARYFRDALVTLYISVSLFSLGSIIGAIVELMTGPSDIYVLIMSGVGILALIYASLQLVRESLLSLRVLEHHLEMVQGSPLHKKEDEGNNHADH